MGHGCTRSCKITNGGQVVPVFSNSVDVRAEQAGEQIKESWLDPLIFTWLV
jgi:hypothetical protein